MYTRETGIARPPAAGGRGIRRIDGGEVDRLAVSKYRPSRYSDGRGRDVLVVSVDGFIDSMIDVLGSLKISVQPHSLGHKQKT
jgi:hypothetical protein